MLCFCAHELLGRSLSGGQQGHACGRVNTMLQIDAKLLGKKKKKEEERHMLDDRHKED